MYPRNAQNEGNDNQVYSDYTIFYIAADKDISNQNNNTQWANNWRGGVSIIIKNEYVGNIKQINRISSRIIEIRRKTGNELNDLSITCPYAP